MCNFCFNIEYSENWNILSMIIFVSVKVNNPNRIYTIGHVPTV